MDNSNDSELLQACRSCRITYPLTVEFFKQQANNFQKTCKSCLEKRSTARKRVALEELDPNQARRPRIAEPIAIAAAETRYIRWDDSQQSPDTFQARKATAAKARRARFNIRNNILLSPSPIIPLPSQSNYITPDRSRLRASPTRTSQTSYTTPHRSRLRASLSPTTRQYSPLRASPRSQPSDTAPNITIDTDYGPLPTLTPDLNPQLRYLYI
jgi:hypothetical protein